MNYLVVVSEFNSMITEPMLQECLRGFKEQDIIPEVITVPGAAEIPVMIQSRLKKKEYAAVVTLGCLIKGETDHYKSICDMVGQGLMQLMLEHSLPIIFEVLMVDSYQKAESRIEKGYHAAFAATQMAQLTQ